MAVQTSQNMSIRPFILSGSPLVREAETIKKNTGRTAALAPYTLMAKVSADGLWEPWDDPTDTNGKAIPQGIYCGDEITAAAIVAANVENCPIIVGGDRVTFDEDQLVIEEGTSPPSDLDSVIAVGTTDQRTARERLYSIGLFAEATIDIDGYENT
jgi:hypothetical protein